MVDVTVQTEGQRLAIVRSQIKVVAPACRRPGERTAAREPVGERLFVEKKRRVGGPIVLKDPGQIGKRSVIESVAIEIAVLPDAEPPILFTELSRRILIDVLHQRMGRDDVGTL